MAAVEHRVGVLIALSIGLLNGSAGAQDPGPPARLAIEPNALVAPGQPLAIKVEGIARGERVELRVFQDCDGDGRPETATRGECRNPLYDRLSGPAAASGTVEDRITADEVKRLPAGKILWLRVSRPGSIQFLQQKFGWQIAPCSLFATWVGTFFGGDCGPGLPQVLRRHRQPSDLVDAIFEVRLLALAPEDARPVSVAATRGVTGVAWIDSRTLLLTAAGSGGEGGLAAGLYRLDLGEDGAPKDAAPERLWSPAAGERMPAAPMALGGGRLAFVLQAPGPQAPGSPPEVAELRVWRGGEVVRRVALPFKVHQLLAKDRRGRSLLALSLGIADNQPTLLVIDLEAGRADNIGFDNALYQAAMRQPGGERSVAAFENAYGGYGWELVLAGGGGEVVRELVVRHGEHDLLPAWRPGAAEVAFLAQVGTVR